LLIVFEYALTYFDIGYTDWSDPVVFEDRNMMEQGKKWTALFWITFFMGSAVILFGVVLKIRNYRSLVSDDSIAKGENI